MMRAELVNGNMHVDSSAESSRCANVVANRDVRPQAMRPIQDDTFPRPISPSIAVCL